MLLPVFLELLNMDSGNCYRFFDDPLASCAWHKNFRFVKEGEVYDCKLMLLDRFVPEKTETSIKLELLDTNAVVGNKTFWKVMWESEIYYIPLS